MAGYTRVDTSNNIADGNVISAADLDNEFDGIQAAFNASTGHNHDGTTGEGAPILVLGPTQDVVVGASTVTPKTTNTVDIGSSSLKFKDLFLAGNASIGGTLAVTGVATLTAQPILSSLTASRAVFTDGSKGLVSNAITGTGNVVMSASPTLTGTITAEALTLSGSVTASGGTANGVAYLNGSKVLTTGSALTFDGSTFQANTAGFRIGQSPADSPSSNIYASLIANTGETSEFWIGANTASVVGGSYLGGLGFYNTDNTTPGANLSGIKAYIKDSTGSMYLNFYAGNTYFDANTPQYTIDPAYHAWSAGTTEGMRLTSTGLGIGTSSPVSVLDVAGTTPVLTIKDTQSKSWVTGDTVGDLDFYSADPSGSGPRTVARIRSFADNTATTVAGALSFWTSATDSAATEKLRITSAGNVGIGTSSPASRLHITGLTENTNAASGTGVLRLTGGASTYSGYIGFDASTMSIGTNNASRGLSFVAGAAERMRIDSAGNVGIGTSSPASFGSGQTTLQVTGNSASFPDRGGIFRSTTYDGGCESFYGVRADDLPSIGSLTNHSFGFYTDNTLRATLDASGNLGLGVTPSAWGSPLASAMFETRNAMHFGSIDSTSAIGYIGVNAYYNGTNWIYKQSQESCRYELNSNSTGAHAWFTAPSGTAGNAITFTQAMTLDASGRLGIGTTAPDTILHISQSSGAALRIESSTSSLALDSIVGSIEFEANDGSAQGTGIKSRISAQSESAAGNAIGLRFYTGSSTEATATEKMRLDSSGNVQTLTGAQVVWAPAPASISTTATLTNANIQGQIINTTGTSYTVTMPLGTTLETLVSWATTNLGYDFTVINTASGTITMAINTGVTSLGGLTIATGTSAQFRIRRTATNTFVLYRMR